MRSATPVRTMQPLIQKRGHKNIRAFFSQKALVKVSLVDDQFPKIEQVPLE
jgi:hypothetical protein